MKFHKSINKPGLQVSGLFFNGFFWIVVFASLLLTCGKRTDSIEFGMPELKRAIKVLEARRDAELRIIDEEEILIEQLKANRQKVNSEGMYQHISESIVLKQQVVARAKINLINQNKILKGLYAKRDSLAGVVVVL